jgi:hypothetical protein
MTKPAPEDILAAAATLRTKRAAYDAAHERSTRADAEERTAQAEMLEASSTYTNLCAELAKD